MTIGLADEVASCGDWKPCMRARKESLLFVEEYFDLDAFVVKLENEIFGCIGTD